MLTYRYTGGAPGRRVSQYPFSLLNQKQKAFLRALTREQVLTIGHAFRSALVKRSEALAAITHWFDDVAFVDAFHETLRSLPHRRRDQVFDTICAFLLRQPIHKICNVPRPPTIRKRGWHARRFTFATGKCRKQSSPIFSESGEDPWN